MVLLGKIHFGADSGDDKAQKKAVMISKVSIQHETCESPDGESPEKIFHVQLRCKVNLNCLTMRTEMGTDGPTQYAEKKTVTRVKASIQHETCESPDCESPT